jgi:hypothetical protein
MISRSNDITTQYQDPRIEESGVSEELEEARRGGQGE